MLVLRCTNFVGSALERAAPGVRSEIKDNSAVKCRTCSRRCKNLPKTFIFPPLGVAHTRSTDRVSDKAGRFWATFGRHLWFSQRIWSTSNTTQPNSEKHRWMPSQRLLIPANACRVRPNSGQLRSNLGSGAPPAPTPKAGGSKAGGSLLGGL